MHASMVSLGGRCRTDRFGFWLHIDTNEFTSSAAATVKVQVLNSSGAG
jgi:hypothetical protein